MVTTRLDLRAVSWALEDVVVKSIFRASGGTLLRSLIVISFVAWFSLLLPLSEIYGGEVLSRVKGRRLLRCGVSDGRMGFSFMDAKGVWRGLDVDFCRAVAAAVIGDSERVRYFPLLTTARFLSLRSNEIDILARNTTWTLGREAGLGVYFIGTLFFDGQGFMVQRKSRVQNLAGLRDAKICVVDKTTTRDNLTDYFDARGWKYQLVIANSIAEASKAFFAGACLAYSSDASNLAAVRLNAPGGDQAYFILPERISKEPLGPVIRRGDDEWFTLLRWIYFAMIEAEERGITSDNISAKAANPRDPQTIKFLDSKGLNAQLLGIQPGWVNRIIQTVGNYGETFERNLGKKSALKLDRGPNRLWSRGGLLYAPPFQ